MLGWLVGGPVGGVAGAIGAGNAVDGAFTVVESAIEGYVWWSSELET